jgi:PAS domain S-box-containing protein
MPIDQFLATADLLPEICLLVTGDAVILAANQSATVAGLSPQLLRGRSFFEITATPRGAIRDYLRACSRSRRLLPGSMILTTNGQESPYHCQGGVFQPRRDDLPAEIFLRLIPKESATSQFLALNQRLDALSMEVRRRQQTELRLREETERLKVTLSSIGDAVIATDDHGRVLLMNPNAEAFTGWKQSEASGRPLSDVFHIVNEFTRQPAENPCERVLREGVVLGLANHTILIARDGSERAIDDSAAPIKDALGHVSGAIFVFRDVTERRKAEHAKSRLAAIVHSSQDAIISKSLEGRITSWNEAAERMFGYTAAEAIGQPIRLLAPEGRADEMREILNRIRRGERVEHFETIRRRKDGAIVPVSLTVSPLRNERGEVIGASKIARDITDRKRADEDREILLKAERAARTEAERANRMKDEFLSTVSHEIRTPLNAILGWTQILRTKKTGTADLEQGLDVIERNARLQTQIIDDLLDMSRIISGKIRLEIQPVYLPSVIESALATVRPAAAAKGISIATKIATEVGPVMADGGRLQQIVWNLLSNAIKFTPREGSIEIGISKVEANIELTVSDTGQGISAEFLPYVFDRFRQADSTTRRQVGGLGLGLAIVKQLTELHGGTVRAHSAGEGRGATFSVCLPIQDGHAPQTDMVFRDSGATSLQSTPSLAGLKVLVVDDDQDSRDLVHRVLSDREATVFMAASAAEGMAALQRERPHMLVSDIGMPHEDGYDFIRKVRALPAEVGGQIPAAALTAFARSEDRTRALLAGYHTHIVKPVDPSELVAVVAALAGRTGR